MDNFFDSQLVSQAFMLREESGNNLPSVPAHALFFQNIFGEDLPRENLRVFYDFSKAFLENFFFFIESEKIFFYLNPWEKLLFIKNNSITYRCTRSHRIITQDLFRWAKGYRLFPVNDWRPTNSYQFFDILLNKMECGLIS